MFYDEIDFIHLSLSFAKQNFDDLEIILVDDLAIMKHN